MQIDVIETTGLGDRSYLVHDGGVGRRASTRNATSTGSRRWPTSASVQIAHVLETHLHNDYVTGGLELARSSRRRLRRPGAATSVAYDRAAGRRRRRPRGRPDAVAGAAHPGAHPPPRQLRAARRHRARCRRCSPAGRCSTAPPAAPTCWAPTHRAAHPRPVPLGAPAGRRAARRHPGLPDPRVRQLLLGHPDQRRLPPPSGEQAEVNPALTQDEQAFVDQLLAGLGAYPAYYAHMGPAQRRRPATRSTCPTPAAVDPDELARRIDAGEWVVDLRSRTAFAAGHLPGALELRAVHATSSPTWAGSTRGALR